MKQILLDTDVILDLFLDRELFAEDAVQHASAVAAGLEGILTRNIADYQQATLPVYTPADYLNLFPIPS